MNRFAWFFVSCFLLGVPLASAKDSLSVFQKANAAYRGGDYVQAASLYESLLKEGVKDASVDYNLGNAYFKQNRLGLALLHYEKARRLGPREPDVRFNLNYARGLVEYRIEDKRNWYSKTWESLLKFFTFGEVGVLMLFFGLIFWSSWILALYLRTGGSGREGVRKTLMVLSMLALSLWVLKGLHGQTVREGVILKPEAAVRYGPSYKDQVALKLAEGMKVRIQKQSEDWYRVSLPNGETGWMFQEDLGVI